MKKIISFCAGLVLGVIFVFSSIYIYKNHVINEAVKQATSIRDVSVSVYDKEKEIVIKPKGSTIKDKIVKSIHKKGLNYLFYLNDTVSVISKNVSVHSGEKWTVTIVNPFEKKRSLFVSKNGDRKIKKEEIDGLLRSWINDK